MRVGTVFLIKAIFNIIFKTIVCVFVTTLIVWLVVIESPEDPLSYVALSVALVIDGLIISSMIPPREIRKYKPKTIAKHLVIWLSIVLYSCIVGVAFLVNACMLAEARYAKNIAVVFACLFGGMALAALSVLLYQFIGYVQIKTCLKHGVESTAEFIGRGKIFKAVNEITHSRQDVVFTGYSVAFKYKDSTGTEKIAKSKSVFSYPETEQLEKAGSFKIKYNKRLAVIAETFEPKDEETEAMTE